MFLHHCGAVGRRRLSWRGRKWDTFHTMQLIILHSALHLNRTGVSRNGTCVHMYTQRQRLHKKRVGRENRELGEGCFPPCRETCNIRAYLIQVHAVMNGETRISRYLLREREGQRCSATRPHSLRSHASEEPAIQRATRGRRTRKDTHRP